MVIPVYIAEISPERSRGKLSSTMGPMYTGGLLVGFAVNVGCVKFELGWRVSLGLQAVFGIILAFGMFFQPRTPRYICFKFVVLTYLLLHTFRFLLK